jgi:hypothetical protein
VPHFAITDRVIGTDEVARVDAALGSKPVDVDRAGGFKGDVVEFILRYFDVGVGIDLISAAIRSGVDATNAVGNSGDSSALPLLKK